MIFQLTPDDMVKAIESVPSEDVPEAFYKMFSRISEEQRVRTINVILRYISKERRIEVINAFIRHISEDKLKEWAKEILDGDKQKSMECNRETEFLGETRFLLNGEEEKWLSN